MKYALVIDSTAALPDSFLKREHVKIAKVNIRSGDALFPDPVEQSKRLKVYEDDLINVKHGIGSVAPTDDEIFEFMMTEVVPNFDVAICQCVTNVGSTIYGSFVNVSNTIPKRAREVRDKIGMDAPFRMVANNTGTLSAGQGLIAIYADIVLSKGMNLAEYTDQVEKFKRVVNGFTIVKNTIHARQRAIERGIETVSFATALIGNTIGMTPMTLYKNEVNENLSVERGFKTAITKLINYAIKHIEKGLYLRAVNVCYAGDLDDIRSNHDYLRLERVAKENKVLLLLSIMPLSAAVNYGPGAFSLGIAPKDQKLSFE